MLHRRSRLLHNHVSCLVYYIEEFKYYPAPNYYQTEVHIYCNSPDYVTTTHAAPTFTPNFWSISLDLLKDCWNTKLIDKSQVHVSIFSSSTFPAADNCMIWENISECYVNLQIIDLAKYNNKNPNLCSFNNIQTFIFKNYKNYNH